jgi:hypothetical protein
MPAIALSLAAFAAVVVVALAALRAWDGWLALRRHELDRAAPDAVSRIDLADMRERLRKLEAIAAGIDL